MIFPLVSLSLALLSTLAVPFCYDDGGIWGDENAELLRKMKFPKKRRAKQE